MIDLLPLIHILSQNHLNSHSNIHFDSALYFYFEKFSTFFQVALLFCLIIIDALNLHHHLYYLLNLIIFP